MMRSANTSGSGRRKRRSSASASRFTRTSLYSQKVPGGRSGRASPLRPLPSTARLRLRSTMSDLPNSVPSHSEVCCSRCRQVMAPLCGPSNPPSSTVRANRLVEIRDQPVGHRDAGQQAEIALGDREGEIDLPRVAPARDLRTAAQDQPVRAAARTDRTEDLVVRRRLEEAGLEMRPQVARPWRLVRQGVADRVVQAGMVSPSRYCRPGYHMAAKARILPPGIAQRGINRRAGQWTGRRSWQGLSATLNVQPCWAARCLPPCEPEELDEILKFASERRVRRGQTIFQRGDNGSSMMAVLRGRVRISSVSGDGKEVTLNVINPGEIFGEIALLDGEPRSADATAIEDTLLLVVERRHFLPFLRAERGPVPAPARRAVQAAAPHQHGAGGDRTVRSAGAPRARAAEAGGGLRPAECRRHANRPEAVAARPQQSRRLVARERQQAVAHVARERLRSIWRTASSCCAGRPTLQRLTDVK